MYVHVHCVTYLHGVHIKRDGCLHRNGAYLGDYGIITIGSPNWGWTLPYSTTAHETYECRSLVHVDVHYTAIGDAAVQYCILQF